MDGRKNVGVGLLTAMEVVGWLGRDVAWWMEPLVTPTWESIAGMTMAMAVPRDDCLPRRWKHPC